MSNFSVEINNVIVHNGDHLPLNKVQTKPKINYKKQQGDNYTIIMVDPDAPAKNNPIYKYWLHLLITNNDQTIVPFEPPTPPINSGEHRYIIYLLKQKTIINKSEIKVSNDKNGNIKRNNFNLAEFIHDHKLEIVDSVYFITENK